MKKFSALLTIVIESSYLGTNFPKPEDFGIDPKVPETLYDVANYVEMIYQILFAKKNGLHKYNKGLELEFLWKNTKYINELEELEKKAI